MTLPATSVLATMRAVLRHRQSLKLPLFVAFSNGTVSMMIKLLWPSSTAVCSARDKYPFRADKAEIMSTLEIFVAF